MKAIVVDTNILLDIILKREPSYGKHLSIFQSAQKHELEIIIVTPVFLEFEWVLRSYYKIEKTQLIIYLVGLVDSFKVENNKIITKALSLYQTNSVISLTDSVIVAEKLLRYPEANFLTNDKNLSAIVDKFC